MERYGLIGHDVGHSISPALHACAFAQFHMDERYGIIDVAPGMIGESMELIRTMAGANVTIPHKRDIMDHIDEVDEAAREIGAINTLVIEDAHILGTNTDWVGVDSAIGERRIRSALIIGAGGAARAAVYALQKRGADVMIFNRTSARAHKLANDFSCTAIDDMGGVGADLLVNATPIGRGSDGTPIGKEHLSRFTTVFDMVYGPIRTRLLRDAEIAGKDTIPGVVMLVHQAAESFFIWTGKRPSISMMMQRAEEELS